MESVSRHCTLKRRHSISICRIYLAIWEISELDGRDCILALLHLLCKPVRRGSNWISFFRIILTAQGITYSIFSVVILQRFITRSRRTKQSTPSRICFNFARALPYQHLIHLSFPIPVLRGDVHGPIHGLLQPRIPRVLRETPTREQQDVKGRREMRIW